MLGQVPGRRRPHLGERSGRAGAEGMRVLADAQHSGRQLGPASGQASVWPGSVHRTPAESAGRAALRASWDGGHDDQAVAHELLR